MFDLHLQSCMTYGKNARDVVTVVNPHCSYTGVKPCRKVKIRASENPLTADSQAMIGSVKSIWNLYVRTKRISDVSTRLRTFNRLRSTPDNEDFFHGEFMFLELIRSVNVRIFTSAPSSLGFSI